MKNNDYNTLKKIIEYCDLIDKLLDEYNHDFFTFQSSKSFQLSTSMCIVQIGEYVNRLTDDFKKQYDNIPWQKIKGMRNIVTHQYDNIDFDILWYTLTVEIQELKEDLLLIVVD